MSEFARKSNICDLCKNSKDLIENVSKPISFYRSKKNPGDFSALE